MSARKKMLEFLKNEAKKPLTEEKLYKKFNINNKEKKIFDNLLEQLQNEGLIYKNRAGKYGIPEKFHLIRGRIERNSKGFSFLIPEDPEQEDIFISLEDMNGAMHNDKVFVRILSNIEGKRSEGEVIKVIERANHKIVGKLEQIDNSYFAFLIPDNPRIYFDIFIPNAELNNAKDGQKVVAKITRWPEKNRNPEGKIVEILGYESEAGVDIESLIRQFELPQKFSAEVLAEADSIPAQITSEDLAGRKDLRNLPLVTIDGEDAKDFDDAVSIEERKGGVVRLGVHIADVTHYVKEDSPLDKEARERGTSIYLVDRVIPMLPETLSNGICSLRPREDRLTFSVFMDFNLQSLVLEDYEIVPSVINSNYRLTYNEVNEILEKNNQKYTKKYSDFISNLKLMHKLSKKLREERFNTGSINFDFPEVKVILDEQGKPVDLKLRKHDAAEKLIEEFMIAANRVVARDMYWREIPFIYRVHDQPDPDRLREFNEFIHNFGYHLKGIENGVHPGALQDILRSVEGTDEEYIIDNILLRTMKKAIYSKKNIGHFGLALNYYTHFTSPIRRYPDLMIHRIIKEVMSKGYLSRKRERDLEEKLPFITDHSSLQERKAMEAERASVDMKKIEYMQDKIGYEYEGIINGVIGFGFFVILPNTVEGLVHVEELKDDYYYIDRELQALIGERKGKIYRLGDKVKVEVTNVNLKERELNFKLVE